MQCPRASCGSTDLHLIRVAKAETISYVVPRYHGHNMTRRRRVCRRCGHRFFTIEIIEDLYEELIAESRLRTDPNQILRKTK